MAHEFRNLLICPRCGGEFFADVRRCSDCDVELVAPEPEPDVTGVDAAAPEEVGDAVVVLRTGRLLEADLAASALEEASVPHFRREESSSGLSFAMPVAPSMGPGTWWTILVPESAAESARAVLESLPIALDESPGVWDFKPTEEAKSVHKIWALGSLILVALALLGGLISLIRQLLAG